MKKVLLTILAAALCFSGMAQNKVQINKDRQLKTPTFAAQNLQKNGTKDGTPTWSQIHTPFVTTDINGNDVNVADTLAAGKYIVIDYSATWCNPCYQFHQSKNLEAIHDQLGSQVCVLWVEADNSTTLADIQGTGSNTQGDWTHYSDGSAVSYPIIDCASCESMIDPTGYVPAVYFVTPEGYYCHIYGESWGLTISMSNSQAVSNIQNLIANAPAPGNPPSFVSIEGPNVAWANQEVGFSVNYVSVDEITGIDWTFSGADVTSANGPTASTTYSTAGNYTVEVTVSNENGSATTSKDITVRDGWTWGDEMDYTDGGDFVSSIGYGGNGEIAWGVKYPAALLSGRNYVTKATLFVMNPGSYDLRIYQGANPSASTLIYENTYNITESEQWVDFNVLGGVAIDQTKDLWVTFHCDGVNYPASYCPYSGDPNSHLIDGGTGWVEIQTLAASLDNVTWMIKTTTSQTAPAFDFAISGPTSGMADVPLTFTVAGPSNATYNWTLQGATPATATGTSVTATWSAAGSYTISVTGSNEGGSATHTMQVNIKSCNSVNGSNYDEGFEDGIECWTLIDADGDGYGWYASTEIGYELSHNGVGSLMSASFINGIGALTPDNWAISPMINLPSESAQIEWWSGALDASYANDYYSVLVSTTDKNPSSFTHTIYAGENESGSFTKHTFPLNEFAGQSIFIAFRHHNCEDVYWLGIDDLKITGTGNVGIDNLNTANLDFYPNPVNDKLYISEAVSEVSVVDINGRIVMTDKNTSVVDMSNLSNGVYFVRVITDNGTSIKKIVKK